MFEIAFDPAPPFTIATKEHWSFTTWEIPDVVLYATALDPSKEYNVTITNIQNNNEASEVNGRFDLRSLTLWRVTPK
jgi:hypothetical protein